jgi:hypothetical protein
MHVTDGFDSTNRPDFKILAVGKNDEAANQYAVNEYNCFNFMPKCVSDVPIMADPPNTYLCHAP